MAKPVKGPREAPPLFRKKLHPFPLLRGRGIKGDGVNINIFQIASPR